jgi:hypothetical protein
MNPAQKLLVASATEHAELGRDYLRAGMPGFALKHLREAVERLEQAQGAKAEIGKQKADSKHAEQPGLIEI